MSTCEGIYTDWCPKDPNAILDYQFDWTDWLSADDDEITTHSVVSSDAALVIDSSSNTTKTVTVWLSGGTVGSKPTVRCRITTAGGRTDDRTARLLIKER